MLTAENFKTRANQLFESCRDRWRKQLQKGLPKGVNLQLPPDQILPFSRIDFQKWLWRGVGLQAVPCGYCRAPIDIISLQLDHKTPFRRGGGPGLDNLQWICARCNGCKGEFTHEEYVLLVAFMESDGAHLRQRLEGVLVNGSMGVMMRRFPKQKSAGPKRIAVQPPLQFSQELSDF